MAELNASERAQIIAAVNEALTADDSSALAAAAAPSAAGDVKDAFCENWPTAKAVLQFLSSYLPPWLRPIVATIIRIGDRVYATICG
jgi:hypothetical protein